LALKARRRSPSQSSKISFVTLAKMLKKIVAAALAGPVCLVALWFVRYSCFPLFPLLVNNSVMTTLLARRVKSDLVIARILTGFWYAAQQPASLLGLCFS